MHWSACHVRGCTEMIQRNTYATIYPTPYLLHDSALVTSRDHDSSAVNVQPSAVPSQPEWQGHGQTRCYLANQ